MSLRAQLTDEILALDGVEVRPSQFGGGAEAFWVGRRELAHFHPKNELDLRLTRAGIRARKAELAADRRATLRGSSDWVEVRFPRRTDLPWVLALVRAAIEANGGATS